MNFTQNEIDVLRIFKLYMIDSFEPAIDVDDLHAETKKSKNSIKGILGSLKKKGIVSHYKVNGRYEVSQLTRTGEKQVKELFEQIS